jgi:hypothetical protein
MHLLVLVWIKSSCDTYAFVNSYPCAVSKQAEPLQWAQEGE